MEGLRLIACMALHGFVLAALQFSQGRDPGWWIAALLLALAFYRLVRRLEGSGEPAEGMTIVPIPLMSGFLGSLAFAGGHSGPTAWAAFAGISGLCAWVLAGFWLLLPERKRLVLSLLFPGLAAACAFAGRWLGRQIVEALLA